MANVSIEINGHRYTMSCEDGQEDHLIRLGRYFDNHVKNLAKSVGQIGDQRLFLMAALLIADENYEIRQKFDVAQAELMRLTDARPNEKAAKEAQSAQLKAEQAQADAELAVQSAKAVETRAVETLDEVTDLFNNASTRLDGLSDELDKA